MAILSVDLGGTWIRGGLVFGNGSVERLDRHRVRRVLHGFDAAKVWDEIVERIGSYASERTSEIERVALAFPGPIVDGNPMVAPTLTGSAPVPPDLVRRLRRRTGVPVGVVNDVAAATAFFASNRSERSFFLVTVSSGIGSRVWRRGAGVGVERYDGEIGHLVVDVGEAAPPCDCGGRGHLASVSSGRAVERRAREIASRDPDAYEASILGRNGVDERAITNEQHLVPAMLAGDGWSLDVLRAAVVPLARVALQIVVAGGLERCHVIGGFATALGRVYQDALAHAMTAMLDAFPIALDPKAIVDVASAETDPVLRGAVLAT